MLDREQLILLGFAMNLVRNEPAMCRSTQSTKLNDLATEPRRTSFSQIALARKTSRKSNPTINKEKRYANT